MNILEECRALGASPRRKAALECKRHHIYLPNVAFLTSPPSHSSSRTSERTSIYDCWPEPSSHFHISSETAKKASKPCSSIA